MATLNLNLGPISILTSLLLLISLIDIFSNITETASWINTIALILISLRIWLTPLYLTANYKPSHTKSFNLLIYSSLLILILTFKAKTMLGYFYLFETILIPIYALVLCWGYQTERLQAATLLFFYTITASLPLLLGVTRSASWIGTRAFNLSSLRTAQTGIFIAIIMMMAFLVKMPIYVVHLWLPKAHVEAPVAGSIILAGILLKLGGYGLCLVATYYNPNVLVNKTILVIAMFGGAILGVLIPRLTDIKVAIAYSSVVHIRMVIATFTGISAIGMVGGRMIIVAHGATSSGIFAGRYFIYRRTHSRRLIANKGILTSMPSMASLWFILIVINFAGPFTLNLFREILIIASLAPLYNGIYIPIILICFFSAAYNLNLYASTQQGRGVKSNNSIKTLNMREMITLIMHLTPCTLPLLSIPNLSDSST